MYLTSLKNMRLHKKCYSLVILPLVGQPQHHPTHANTVDNKSALLLIILIPRPI